MNAVRIPLLLLLLGAGTPVAVAQDNWTGAQIMQAVHVRQQEFPFVYEEQSIVLVDSNGARDTRKARRYSRIETDGRVNLLIVFETPPAVRGVALLAVRDPAGNVTQQLYLPALGQRLIEGESNERDGGFMGSDFTVESLTGEMPSQYQYLRGDDVETENQEYFTVDVYAADADMESARPVRRHMVRKDNFYITRTDYFDARGEVARRQRAYDLKLVDDSAWHANLILMDDLREQHQTLIKIDRRVFSRDYVPEKVFSAAWLFEQYPMPEAEGGDGSPPVANRGADL